jgi:hypothetical protein
MKQLFHYGPILQTVFLEQVYKVINCLKEGFLLLAFALEMELDIIDEG